MNDTATEYLDGKANGREKTPAEKAWDTAREQARQHGRSVRDEEIRCIKSKALSAWAKLFFWILSKCCWESSPFLHNRRVGSVCITGPDLKKYYGFPTKRLYAQTRHVKDKTGKIIATRRTTGAIEELVNQGFIWVSRKQVRNIPAAKWPNVFNLATLMPQGVQPKLGLLEDVFVEEENENKEPQYTNGGVRIFLGKNERGSSQTLENGLAKPREEHLPDTNGESSQAPRAGFAKDQRGDLPSPPSGVTTDTNGGTGEEPPVVQAHSRDRDLARPASRIPLKTSDQNHTFRQPDCVGNGASHTPMPRFEPLDTKMVPRLRKQWGEESVETIKGKIFRLENSRQPLPNQKEIIGAYKQRIRDIKDWINGEISSTQQKAAARTAART